METLSVLVGGCCGWLMLEVDVGGDGDGVGNGRGVATVVAGWGGVPSVRLVGDGNLSVSGGTVWSDISGTLSRQE